MAKSSKCRPDFYYLSCRATGDVKLNGIMVTIGGNTKKAEHIERIAISAESRKSPYYLVVKELKSNCLF